MGLLVVILIIFSIICLWRGKVILDDFPSPRIVYCYKKIAIVLFSLSVISFIISIVIIIDLFSGSGD